MIAAVLTMIGCSLLAAAPGHPPPGVAVEATRLDGSRVRGRVVALAPRILLDTSEGRAELPWQDVLGIRVVGGPRAASRPATPEPLRFELTDGSRFTGRIVAASQPDLAVRFRGERTARIALSALEALTSTSASVAARRELDALRGAPRPAQDVAVLARGDDALVLRGTVRQIGVERVRFIWNERELKLPLPRLAGLIFAHPTPRGASCTITLHNGDVFAGRVTGGDGQALALQSGVFDELVLPWASVARIDCRSERLVFLSDLQPARYEFEPLFDKRWDYARDRTLTGRPIRLGGRRYDKGITMHSRAALAYGIGGAFRQFAASAGIVDEMGERGCVTLRVIGDGELLWEASGVRGGQAPREVLVDVGGVDELVLIVDYDRDLDLSDHACWAFARLIR